MTEQKQMGEKSFRFLMIMIFLAAAIETDIYLPAFPDMMTAFNTTEQMIQRILSFNFIGICLASLFYGPASDAFGRRKVLNFGYLLFILGSFGCIWSETIETLIFWRFLQGLGSAACFIIGTAVIFDMYQAEKAAKVIGELNSLVVSLMAFAPMIGGWLNHHFGYQYNFFFIAVLSVLSAGACFLKLPETLPDNKRKKLTFGGVLKDYLVVLQNGQFWVNTLITTLIFAGYMIYVSNMSLVFVNHLGVPETQFPWYQFAILVVFVIASESNGRLISWIGTDKMKNLGGLLLIISSLMAWFAPSSWQNNPVIVNIFMSIYSAGAGICIGIFFARSMEACPELTGISSSLVTSLRLILTSLLIDLSGVFFNGTMEPVIELILYCILISVVLFGLYEISSKRQVQQVDEA